MSFFVNCVDIERLSTEKKRKNGDKNTKYGKKRKGTPNI